MALAAVPVMRDGLVVFRLGGERYGIPLSCVRELGRVPPITLVPRLPAFVSGVANLRGNVLAIIDLRPVVGTSAASAGDPNARRMMVVNVDGVVAGVLVDAVDGVIDVVRDLDPPVPTLSDGLKPFVRGHLQHERSLITVLEPSVVGALRERVEAEAG